MSGTTTVGEQLLPHLDVLGAVALVVVSIAIALLGLRGHSRGTHRRWKLALACASLAAAIAIVMLRPFAWVLDRDSTAIGDWHVWLLVVMSVATAVAFPLIMTKRLTPELLREHSLLSKPGRVVAGASLLLAVLSLTAALTALAALAYPFLWATVALMASGAFVVVMYLVRHRAAARAFEADARGRP